MGNAIYSSEPQVQEKWSGICFDNYFKESHFFPDVFSVKMFQIVQICIP